LAPWLAQQQRGMIPFVVALQQTKTSAVFATDTNIIANIWAVNCRRRV